MTDSSDFYRIKEERFRLILFMLDPNPVAATMLDSNSVALKGTSVSSKFVF